MTEESATQPHPTSISDLRPGMQLEGVVKRIELYGAFVDVGLERDGLIHISQLSDRRVSRVADVVNEGDRVTAWVVSVDAGQGRIALTLVKPPDVEWRDLAEGQTHTGRVVRLERYGAFVDIGAERPGLLHAREMGGHAFRRPSEMFREGDEVEVRILQVDRRKKRIDLTMEDLVDTVIEDEEDEDLPTPIELAFRRAEKKARSRERPRETAKSTKRSEQDDLLARTLERHGG